MVRRATRLLASAVVVGVFSSGARSASAQSQAPAPPAVQAQAPGTSAETTPAAPAAESKDPVERARVHYERGLQLFNEENNDAALFEFERAFELAPSYKILYNMGRIQRQQNNYAAAMRSYERYLREGGAAVPADRRAEVERELAVLKPRVARVTVKVNVDGADVYQDDAPVCTATIESSCVGKSPLDSPIIVNGGRHKITATKQGYAPATSLVSVVGSDAIEVKLDLVSYDRPQAPPANPWTLPAVVGWSATGATLIGAGVFGILSLKAKDKQQAKLTDPNTTQSDLSSARDKTQTLSAVTDVLFATTVVFAGFSSYFTLRMLGATHKEGQPPATAQGALNVSVSPTGLAAFGSF